MRLVILGATGGTGQQLLKQALTQGHQVTVLVRRAEAITLTHPQLQVTTGDVMQADSLASVLPGQDAVLSVVGQRSLGPMTFYRQSARNITEQMEQVIRSSGVVWTIVRPSRLIDGKRRGHYRIGLWDELAHADSISRADLAECMLAQVASKVHWYQATAVAY